MKEQHVQFKFRAYENLAELAMADQVLMQEAQQALSKSYSPYSGFRVAAAALLQNGIVVSGANQENASYPMCLCAEMVTVSRVESEFPGTIIECLAITVKGKKESVVPAAPCGACRQILFEKESRQGQALRILMMGEKGPVYELFQAKDLLPFAFSGSFLGG